MYLKNLEMQGFKSFVDKISIEFGKGITAIVGPNGSGKSNISDALRWVMGEQSIKSLRGSKMEDVIFSGTEKIKPTGFAEVTLLLDNRNKIFPLDYEEIAVTRRIFRSGESEYFINKAACRLRDIHELFMDTGLGRDGYSIIGQGRIDEILSNKSEDRRQIFEEAAGISKYKYKKQEATRKLEHTEENIERAADIVGELEVRLEPLKRQSEKAIKYLAIRDELKILDVNLALEMIDEFKNSAESLEGNLAIMKAQAEDESQVLEQCRTEEETRYGNLRESEGKMEQIRQRLHEIQVLNAKTEGEISLLNNNIERYKGEVQRANEECDAILEEIEEGRRLSGDLGSEISELSQRKQKKQGEIEQKNNFFSELSQKTDEENLSLNNLIQEKGKIEREEDLLRSRINTIEALGTSADETALRLCEKADAAVKSGEQAAKELAAAEKSLLEANQALGSIREEYAAARDELGNVQAKISGLKSFYNEKSEAHNKKISRLTVLRDMEKNMEGYSQGVKALLTSNIRNEIKLYGVLSKLISVEGKYTSAIQAALGSSLQNIVVENENDAKKAIEYLKANNLGRITFLPVATVKGRRGSFENDLKREQGYEGLACDFVGSDDRYREIIESLLGRTAVFGSFDTAAAAAKKYGHSFKAVTLGGEVFMPGGSITGGGSTRSTGLIGREKEIGELAQECRRLSAEMDKTDDKIDKNTEALQGCSEKAKELLEREQAESRDVIRYRSECDLKKQIIELHREEAENAEVELKQIKLAGKDSEKEKERLAVLAEEFSENAALAEEKINDTRERLRAYLIKKENVSGEIIELRMAVSGIENEIDLRKMKIESYSSERERKTERLNKIEEIKNTCSVNIEKTGWMIENKRVNIREAEDRVREFENEIGLISQNKSEADSSILELKEEIRRRSETVNALKIECARMESKAEKAQQQQDDLISRLWDDYDLTRSEALSIRRDIGNRAEAKKNAAEMRIAMKALGNININAIDEYKEIKERYDFLTEQINDLNTAKSELTQLIREMTERMRDRFTEQFEIINKNFEEVFRELFGGGNAGLSLADPENILESGIEIEARPPGKKLQRISLLSGGEMALTAIAILFAILKVRPTPFCILDEIEAALDDDNIVRFANYVRKYSADTQFIIVTHRRGTMAAANVLYGVTMQEKGVSKLLTLKLDNREESVVNE